MGLDRRVQCEVYLFAKEQSPSAILKYDFCANVININGKLSGMPRSRAAVPVFLAPVCCCVKHAFGRSYQTFKPLIKVRLTETTIV